MIEGCSEDAVETNIRGLMREGYDRDQAVAIAYDTAMENIEKCGPERQAELRRERRS